MSYEFGLPIWCCKLLFQVIFERVFKCHRTNTKCSITANLGDVKTTITHPASTSHGRLSEAQRQAAGIGQGLVRVSVGLEHLDDLKADLLRGLDTLP